MTLRQLHALALQHMPKVARFPKRWWQRKGIYAWVPGHELAHALLATPEQLTKRRLGLCKIRDCHHPRQSCLVIEACATMLSCAWHIECGRSDLRDEEMLPEVTPGIDMRDRSVRRRAIRRLKKQKLWPIPSTIGEIEAAFAAKE